MEEQNYRSRTWREERDLEVGSTDSRLETKQRKEKEGLVLKEARYDGKEKKEKWGPTCSKILNVCFV